VYLGRFAIVGVCSTGCYDQVFFLVSFFATIFTLVHSFVRLSLAAPVNAIVYELGTPCPGIFIAFFLFFVSAFEFIGKLLQARRFIVPRGIFSKRQNQSKLRSPL
jgi:uncharacterized oligopeptide transporter (OPT) family protein